MRKLFAVLCALFASCSLIAIDLGTELNLSAGYRQDYLRRKNTIAFVRPTVDEINKINIKDIHLGVIGFDMRLMIPPADSRHDATILNNFYVRGFAYWGLSGRHAKLHETAQKFDPPSEKLARAILKNVRTCDYQIGLAYLFDFRYFGISLSSGYAYNHQIIKSKHGQIASLPGPFVDAAIFSEGYKTKTRWQGPWVGTELFYEWCNLLFTLGYEYHFADYHMGHKIPITVELLSEEIANRAHSQRAYGNIVFLNARYRFSDGWHLEAYFKYQNWNACARLKHAQGTFADLGFPETTSAKTTERWSSFSIVANIGYHF